MDFNMEAIFEDISKNRSEAKRGNFKSLFSINNKIYEYYHNSKELIGISELYKGVINLNPSDAVSIALSYLLERWDQNTELGINAEEIILSDVGAAIRYIKHGWWFERNDYFVEKVEEMVVVCPKWSVRWAIEVSFCEWDPNTERGKIALESISQDGDESLAYAIAMKKPWDFNDINGCGHRALSEIVKSSALAKKYSSHFYAGGWPIDCPLRKIAIKSKEDIYIKKVREQSE